MFNFGAPAPRSSKPLRTEPKPEKFEAYKVPDERSAGRPHEMGWLEKLTVPEEERMRLGQIPPGSIISDS